MMLCKPHLTDARAHDHHHPDKSYQNTQKAQFKILQKLLDDTSRTASWHDMFTVAVGLQTIDVGTADNRTFLQYHKYPSVEGMRWKSGTNRITAHTDESLITLLYTSPSEPCADPHFDACQASSLHTYMMDSQQPNGAKHTNNNLGRCSTPSHLLDSHSSDTNLASASFSILLVEHPKNTQNPGPSLHSAARPVVAFTS